jgi:tungstate transport system substrate-binding protein
MRKGFLKTALCAVAALAVSVVLSPGAFAQSKKVVIFSTTSTRDSGLMDILGPAFTKATGYQVEGHYVGSGAALKAGQDGEADVLLVHSPAAEKKYMKKGYGLFRHSVMYNSFYVVGPAAPIAYNHDIMETLKQIASGNLKFVSRDDKSGTDSMEKSLWKKAGINPLKLKNYIRTGSGMAATLKVADNEQAYTLSDSATWLKQKQNFDLKVICDGATPLLNYYSVILVNPKNSKRVNTTAGKAFADWILGSQAQELIKGYTLGGQVMFTPNLGKW